MQFKTILISLWNYSVGLVQMGSLRIDFTTGDERFHDNFLFFKKEFCCVYRVFFLFFQVQFVLILVPLNLASWSLFLTPTSFERNYRIVPIVGILFFWQSIIYLGICHDQDQKNLLNFFSFSLSVFRVSIGTFFGFSNFTHVITGYMPRLI